jgi:hypothetical protein
MVFVVHESEQVQMHNTEESEKCRKLNQVKIHCLVEHGKYYINLQLPPHIKHALSSDTQSINALYGSTRYLLKKITGNSYIGSLGKIQSCLKSKHVALWFK